LNRILTAEVRRALRESKDYLCELCASAVSVLVFSVVVTKFSREK
jgi:hypothetical protein